MRDKHTLRAWREGYKGRAVYKIKEINNKFGIIKKKDKVLDLGCYPGSWIQYLIDLECNCFGIDLKKVNGIDFNFIMGDVYDNKIIEKLNKDFDVVVSDLAPNTTGIRDLDQERSLDLCYRALEIASRVLKPKGNFLVKMFNNDKMKKFVGDVGKKFGYVYVFKPKVSKKRSKEIYIICKSKF